MRSTRPAGHAMYREIFGDEDDELSDCMEVEDFSDDKSLPVGKSVKLVGVVLSKSATKQDVPPKPVSKKGRPPLNGKSTSGQKKPLGRPRTRKSTDGKNASAKSSAGNARKLSNGKKMRRVTLPQVGDSNGKEACLPELAVIHMSEASDGKEKEDFIHGPTESAVSHVQEPSDDQEKEGLILGLLPMVETTVDNTVLSDMASTRVETPPMHQKIDKRRSEPTRKFSFNKVIRSSFRLTPSRKPKRLSAPNTSIPSPPAQKREAIPTSARRSDRLLFAHIVEQVSPSQSEEVSASHANVLSKSTKTKRKTVENGLLEESALSPYLASPVQDETDQLVPVEETPQWQSRPLPSSSSENDAGTSKKIVNLEDAAGDITVIDAPSPRRRTIRKKSADEYVTPLVSSRSGDESINLERSVEIVNATMGTTVIDTATARRRLKRKKVPQDDEHVTPQLSSRLRDVSITAENDKAVLDAAMSTTILDTPSPRRRSIRTKIAQDELVAPQPSSRLRDDSMAVEKGMDLLNAAKGTTVLDTPSPRRRSIRTKIAQDELVAPQASFRLRDDSMTAEKDMDVLDAAMSTTILDTPSPRRRSIRTKIAQDDLVAPQPSSRLRDDSITAERGMELLDAAKGTTVLDTPSSRRRSIRTKVAQDELVAPPFSPHLEDDSQISNAAMEILMFDTPSTRRQAAKVARQKQETIAAEWKSQTPEHAMTPDLIPNSLDHPEGKQTSAKRPKRKRGLPSKFRDDSTSMNSSTPTSRDRSPPFASPIDTTKTLVYKITIPKPPGASAPSNPSTSLLVQADGSNTSTDLNSALNSVQQLDAITPTAVPQPLDILGPATPAKGTPDISGDPTTATSSILDDSSGLPAQTDDGGTPPPGQQQPSVMNESAADNTSTLEIQNSSCMRPLYASFGKCKNCLGKVAGRACQFNGFRAFRRLNHTLGGKAEFTSHDPPHWLCPQFSRRKLLEPALAYKLRLAYSAFRDLVEIELSHIVAAQSPGSDLYQPPCIRKPTPFMRSTCDACEQGIYNAYYMCTVCGQDICLLCVKEVFGTPFFPETSCESSKLPGWKRMVTSCTLRRTHGRSDLVLISRFTRKQMEDARDWMQQWIYWDTEQIQALICQQDLQHEDDLKSALGCEDCTDDAHAITKQTDMDDFINKPHPRLLSISYEDLSNSLFQSCWRKRKVVFVTGMADRLTDAWQPDVFSTVAGVDVVNIHDCRTGLGESGEQNLEDFLSGFGKDGTTHPRRVLKLKDWPTDMHFQEKMPFHASAFLDLIPQPLYTHPTGAYNMATHIAHEDVPPDLGPKTYAAYGYDPQETGGTTNLHLDVADAANVMVWSQQHCANPSDSDDTPPLKPSRMDGAIWDIFPPPTLARLRTFLRNDYVHVNPEIKFRIDDPIHDQTFFLHPHHLRQLALKYNVIPIRLHQKLGDTVFIPAGFAHQVSNYGDCIKCALDFVSAEGLGICEDLCREFRLLGKGHGRKGDTICVGKIAWDLVKTAMTS